MNRPRLYIEINGSDVVELLVESEHTASELYAMAKAEARKKEVYLSDVNIRFSPGSIYGKD